MAVVWNHLATGAVLLRAGTSAFYRNRGTRRFAGFAPRRAADLGSPGEFGRMPTRSLWIAFDVTVGVRRMTTPAPRRAILEPEIPMGDTPSTTPTAWPPAAERRPRLWPGVLIVALYWAVLKLPGRFEAEPMT